MHESMDNKKSINEMEQIQKGLERFLEKEVEGYKKNDKDNTGTKLPLTNDFSESPDNNEEEIKLDMLPEKQNQMKGENHDQKKNIKNDQKKNEKHNQMKDIKRDQIKTEKQDNSEINKTDDIKQKKIKKKKKRKKIILLTILAIIIIIIGIFASGWFSVVNYVYEKMEYEEIENLTTTPMTEEGVTNILLIGNDSRKGGEGGRSDAMILISISKNTKTIYMTSLLRDIYVDIPGYKANRLNAAYSYGGAELLMETIEQNFGITINRYALANFQGFANLIDAVGGVDLELTTKELEYVNGYLVEYNILQGNPEGTDYMDTSQSGMVHLNGPQALAYCRNRYIGTDFARTERQRNVLSAAFKQMPGTMIKNPVGLIDGIMPNVTTNLTEKECLSLSLQGGKFLTYDIIQNTIPIEGSYKSANIRGMAVIEVDFEQNKKFIQENIYGLIE